MNGVSSRPEYTTWLRMKNRCSCGPSDQAYSNYAGRGIRVCDEWRSDFSAFFAYMGPRPSPKHSIDRYPDNDGNYRPGNCRWATAKEQNGNKQRRGRDFFHQWQLAAEAAGQRKAAHSAHILSGGAA
jgi:hypothetical protein